MRESGPEGAATGSPSLSPILACALEVRGREGPPAPFLLDGRGRGGRRVGVGDGHGGVNEGRLRDRVTVLTLDERATVGLGEP